MPGCPLEPEQAGEPRSLALASLSLWHVVEHFFHVSAAADPRGLSAPPTHTPVAHPVNSPLEAPPRFLVVSAPAHDAPVGRESGCRPYL